jgi:predicted RNase H-like HicB family nuclease
MPLIILQVQVMKVSVAIHKEGEWYVAIDPVTGVASQGKSMDEALKNFQEAFELWFENAEEWEKERAMKGEPVATMVIEIKV